ncbi:DUF6562 domain-containing protein [Bacteroides rodentium]|uniref:DUF6562 domain-containing protein n=1 Tax=Bacteroides rodentium TaxID=691816 RepID=UPI000AEB1843|nr:DUF6562 domain-containing protein [Bacteroides rodentium]
MKKILLIWMWTAFLCGCQLHEEPELTADGETGVDPTTVTLTANLALNINLSEKSAPRVTSNNSDYLHRFIVEAYLNRRPVKRQVIMEEITDRTRLSLPVSMQLHARNYQLVVWSDYVKADAQNEDLYYDTESLVPLIPAHASHTGNTEYKDAFAASVPVDLSNYRDQWNAEVPVNVELARPVARYELIANDVASFLRKAAKGEINGTQFTARIKYSNYLSVGYNALDDIPKHSLMYMQYSKVFTLPAEGATELTLGLDYVFVAAGEEVTYIPVEIEIVDEKSVTVANNVLRIPCTREKNSTVKGAFLTETSGNGIDFDPDYDGEVDLDVDIKPL